MNLKKFFRNDYYYSIAEDDILAKQRYILFRIFTVTCAIAAIALAYQTHYIVHAQRFITHILLVVFAGFILNYIFLQRHRNIKVSYAIVVLLSFLVLHILSYFSGGIRNSSNFFLGTILLSAFMLLGNRAGKIFTLIFFLHFIFFYLIRNNSELVISLLTTDDLIDQDFLTTGILATFLIAALCNYLESGKNIVIMKITESRDVLREKNKELKKLSLVASKTNNSVIITNSKGVVEWVNDGFTRMMGFAYDEVIGKKTSVLMHGEETNHQTVLLINQKLAVGKSCNEEIIKYKKDGSKIWLQENITPIVNEKGEAEKYIFIESDITERKNAETKMDEYMRDLEKTNRELDKFAYVVSHDLKAPLRAIGNLTGWIEEDMGDQLQDSLRQNFNIIKGRVVRMEALINGILDYSKAGKSMGQHVSFDTKTLLKETFDLVGAPSNCKLKIANQMPILHTDKTKLQQTFLNLINNAIKYNDKDEISILISAFEEKDFWHFTVTDNGPGIEKQYHDKIFVIFQTLNARDQVESTGVGLAIVKKIIEEQGGQIWVESEKGKGAVFHFTWSKSNQKNTENIGLAEYVPV